MEGGSYETFEEDPEGTEAPEQQSPQPERTGFYRPPTNEDQETGFPSPDRDSEQRLGRPEDNRNEDPTSTEPSESQEPPQQESGEVGETPPRGPESQADDEEYFFLPDYGQPSSPTPRPEEQPMPTAEQVEQPELSPQQIIESLRDRIGNLETEIQDLRNLLESQGIAPDAMEAMIAQKTKQLNDIRAELDRVQAAERAAADAQAETDAAAEAEQRAALERAAEVQGAAETEAEAKQEETQEQQEREAALKFDELGKVVEQVETTLSKLTEGEAPKVTAETLEGLRNVSGTTYEQFQANLGEFERHLEVAQANINFCVETIAELQQQNRPDLVKHFEELLQEFRQRVARAEKARIDQQALMDAISRGNN